MAVFHDMLLQPLGMFLCLSLQLSSATFIRYSSTCFTFDEYDPVTLDIKASSHIYESNAVYSVFVPVNDSVYAVVMKTLDENSDSAGLWQRADENCYSNSTYYVKDQYTTVLEAQWQAPEPENITEVEIQAFTVQIRALPILSTLKLREKLSTLALAAKIPQSSAFKPFFMITPKSIRLEGLANQVFSSPITDAIYILLAFLTSTLLPKGKPGKQLFLPPLHSPTFSSKLVLGTECV
ncbi:placenta-expressed transcript 1 protein [Gorilla gorilla gorilla]|uniref:placenta-expressed transcript 1 protein n=1 Tax=Gorilla gorilla gorilla TaxID=9595 RepID=UPI0001FA1BC9|nr:placenta-expressed transcript 1 protein [Gorilla gorilla gorilla]